MQQIAIAIFRTSEGIESIAYIFGKLSKLFLKSHVHEKS